MLAGTAMTIDRHSIVEVPIYKELNLTLVEQLAHLAEQVEIDDPIDWAMLEIEEHDAYMLMASNVLEMYLSEHKDHRDMVMLATTVKLVVENLVLNMRLIEATRNRDERDV
jgi:hypothetical protein